MSLVVLQRCYGAVEVISVVHKVDFIILERTVHILFLAIIFFLGATVI